MNARRIGLIVLILALVGAGVVVTRIVTQSDQEDIFLEGVGETGRNPFTTIAVVTPTTTTSTSTSLPDQTTTTALFGGSGNQKVCDKAALLAFLVSHPDKGQAWVDAQNSDPLFKWSGTGKLTLQNLPMYFDELTPTFLAVDTRVTNHSFVNGKAVPHQSLLQAGTAVLVDRDGIPRARCACGNPLFRPHKVDDPHYKGHCWPGCHDRPPCSPPGCVETTTTVPETTTSSSTTTTSCTQVPGATNCNPPPSRTTLKPTTSVTRPSTTTTANPTTTTTIGRTTTTTIPSTQTTVGKP
ncbi:MAG TPA: DUF6777 domain-containing protein [Acidimicrobiales bacterium]|nr:DUF6777 domain-containing protein [Acidimicrobiales bacterium]